MSSSSPFGPTFRKIREDLLSPLAVYGGGLGHLFVPLSWLNHSKF